MKNPLTYLLIFLAAMLLVQGCASTPTPFPLSEKTNGELAQILESFESPTNYNPPYSFPEVVSEIALRGPTASELSPILARAMAFDRRDSVIASEALIAIGSTAKSAIPNLLHNLDDSREDVRLFSIFVLGVLGEPAGCAVPKISSLLWDTDPFVRSASAAALTEITRNNLVEFDDLRLDPSIPGSVNADDPEGSISGIARNWWLATGKNVNWPTENCQLLQ